MTVFVQRLQSSPHGRPTCSQVVRDERLTPELGDARLRVRKERAAGARDDRQRARVRLRGEIK
jgi:hypothetical protein